MDLGLGCVGDRSRVTVSVGDRFKAMGKTE